MDNNEMGYCVQAGQCLAEIHRLADMALSSLESSFEYFREEQELSAAQILDINRIMDAKMQSVICERDCRENWHKLETQLAKAAVSLLAVIEHCDDVDAVEGLQNILIDILPGCTRDNIVSHVDAFLAMAETW